MREKKFLHPGELSHWWRDQPEQRGNSGGKSSRQFARGKTVILAEGKHCTAALPSLIPWSRWGLGVETQDSCQTQGDD